MYESENVDTDVTDLSASSTLSGSGDTYILSAPATTGFTYLKISDPRSGTKIIKEVIRSDGKIIKPENAWLSKSRDEDNNWLYYFNLFDANTTASYTVTFENPSAGPQPPVLQFIPDREREEGQQLGFIVAASDPNGTIPILSASPLPMGAVFSDNGNGIATFDWTPATGQAGEYVITFSASDGELTASRTAIITIFGQDSDNDGMPDYWELKYFDSLDRDGTGDYDGDGISDLDEYLNGSNPLLRTYELILEVTPEGRGILSPTEGLYPYSEGDVVEIQAFPEPDFRFSHWTGDVADTQAASTSVTMDSSKTVTAVFISDSIWNLDIDGNGTLQVNKDGFLLMRYLYNVRGENLIAGAVGSGAGRTTAAEIEEYIAQGIAAGVPDIDGNQTLQANKDGFLIMRYLYNVRGENLIAGSVGSGAVRITAAEIEAYIQSLYP